jgi:hypothetical protein
MWTLVAGIAAVVGLFLFTTGAGAVTRKAVPRLWGGGGVCRSLMSDPAAVKEMRARRAEHVKDMQAWWQRYGSDPTSSAAREALKKLRQEHWHDMQQLFKKYGIARPGADPRRVGEAVGPRHDGRPRHDARLRRWMLARPRRRRWATAIPYGSGTMGGGCRSGSGRMAPGR